jgi:hypothetical protein
VDCELDAMRDALEGLQSSDTLLDVARRQLQP